MWPTDSTSHQRALSAMTRPTPFVTAVACIVTGGVLLVINDAINKWLVAAYPVGEIIFFRSLFSLPLIFVLAWRFGGLASLRIRAPRQQIVRATLVLANNFLFITALRLMPLAEAIALTFAAPLFVAILAPVVLKERVSVSRWIAMILGFCGVIVALRPEGTEIVRTAALLPLGAAFSLAVRDVVTRQLTVSDSSVATFAISTAVVTAAAACTAFFGWHLPTPADFALFTVGGVTLGLAHFLMIEAFRHAEAAAIAPFIWLELLWSAAIGYVFWREIPGLWVVVGAMIIAGSSLFLLRAKA